MVKFTIEENREILIISVVRRRPQLQEIFNTKVAIQSVLQSIWATSLLLDKTDENVAVVAQIVLK